jgi:tRNA A37 threonylcarbamoyltransferase TsaD
LNGVSFTREGVGLPKGSINERLRYRLEHHQLSGLPQKHPYLVLGIESSCDDTGVAVVSSDGRILSNVVYSQNSIHNKFGGVVPSLAMEAHKENIVIAIERAISEAGLVSVQDIDAIAVTKGPGLEICLRIGLRQAQALAGNYNRPFVTVHHHEAHCLLARLAGERILSMDTPTPKETTSESHPGINGSAFIPKVDYPFLVLLASGGHTSLLLCRGLGDYDFLGGTLDDALGEGFDKAARLLGLPMGNSTGGPIVEKYAKYFEENREEVVKRMEELQITLEHSMKPPMRDRRTCDFSYAGLKNSFRKEVVKYRTLLGLDSSSTNAPAHQMEEANEVVTLPYDIAAYLCHAYQEVAFQHVEDRLKRAFQYLDERQMIEQLKGLVVVGGVAANMELRKRLLHLLEQRETQLPLVFPPLQLCTDNGVMAAWAGIEMLSQGISHVIDEQEVIPKWNIGNPLPDRPGYTAEGPIRRKASSN